MSKNTTSHTARVSFSGAYTGRIMDWNRFNPADRSHREKMLGAFQHFFNKAENAKIRQQRVAAQIRHFATADDFPTEPGELVGKFHNIDYVDAGVDAFFRDVDMTGSRASSVELRDIGTTLTFQEIAPGGKLEVYKIAGVNATVPFIRRGAALGWERELFEDHNYYTLEDTAMDFMVKFKKAQVQAKVTLVEAIRSLAGTPQNVAWQTFGAVPNTDPLYQALRDAETINAAAYKLVTECSELGMNVGPETPLVLACPLLLRGRIKRAMNVNLPDNAAVKVLDYNITPVATTHFSSNRYWYLAVPGQKSQAVTRMNLEIKNREDIMTRSEVTAAWWRGIEFIGETKQVVVGDTQ